MRVEITLWFNLFHRIISCYEIYTVGYADSAYRFYPVCTRYLAGEHSVLPRNAKP